MSQLNRREFVALTVAGVCAACSGDFAAADAVQSKPPVNLGDVATAAPRDGVFDAWKQQHRFLLVRGEGKIYACSARCTHKGGLLNVDAGQIVCPKHGSRFDAHGIPTDGPAKAPLFRYAIKTDDNGRLVVDLNKTFVEKEWEKPASFVTA